MLNSAEGHGNPLQYSCLENPHGQRSLAGYSPWGHKESDTTERLSTQHMRVKDQAFNPAFDKDSVNVSDSSLLRSGVTSWLGPTCLAHSLK